MSKPQQQPNDAQVTAQWLQKRVQALLGFDKPEDAAELVKYTLTLSPEEMEAHLIGLLSENDTTFALLDELFERLGIAYEEEDPQQASPNPLSLSHEGLKLYVKSEDDDIEFQYGPTKKKKGQQAPQKQGQPQGGSGTNMAYRKDMTVVYKKKKKGQTGAAGPDRVRAQCNCQARVHPLVNNCTRCGRIVCEQEGPGECFHCGHLVVPLGQIAPPVVKPTSAASDADRVQKGLQKAQQHLDKLLEYDQNAVKRTTVYDDQSDYFDMSSWLSPEERKFLKAKEEQLEKEKEARKNKFTIDLTGRKIVSQDQHVFELEEQIKKEIRETIGGGQGGGNFFNPSLEGPRPSFVTPKQIQEAQAPKQGTYAAAAFAAVQTPPPSTAGGADDSAANRRSQAKKQDRVQHEFFPEVEVSGVDFEALAAAPVTLPKDPVPVNLRGIVEGYYGRVWNVEERKSLVEWMATLKGNYYIYGPKDDPLHRKKWQDFYSHDQMEGFKATVELAKSKAITFNYALHPMGYNYISVEHYEKICEKIKTIHEKAGVTHFSIFFDDIESSIPAGFRSLALAQASLINKLVKSFDDLVKTQNTKTQFTWVICPTQYHCHFENGKETDRVAYLQELNAAVDKRVTFLWTGPTVISAQISLPHLKKLKGLLGARKVIIWDNTPVNDYKRHIQFLNPYAGRNAHIGSFVGGVLLNPMDDPIASRVNVGCALDFLAKPTENADPVAPLKRQLLSLLNGDSDAAATLLEFVLIAPSNALWRPVPPASINTGKPEESTWFTQQATKWSKLRQSPKMSGGLEFSLNLFIITVQAFLDANVAFFKALAGKSDAKLRIAATDSLRALRRTLIPSIRNKKDFGILKHALIGANTFIASNEIVKAIETNLAELEQIEKASIAQQGYGGPEFVRSQRLQEFLTEDFYDLEAYLITAYNDADLEAWRLTLNMIFLGLGGTELRLPFGVTPPVVSPNAAVLQSWKGKLKQRQAEALKAKQEAEAAANAVAAQIAAATAPPAVPTPEKPAKPYEVKTQVPGLRFVKNFLTAAEETKLLDLIDKEKWNSTLSRRTIQYGYIYDYSAVDKQNRDEPRLSVGSIFPGWLQSLADRLHRQGYTAKVPDQCIINEYKPGQGIKPHVDHIASFDDTIVSVTLASAVSMDFKSFKTSDIKSVYLEPRSLVILQGDSRSAWSHAIEARDYDEVDGKKIKRNRRISLTFRKITPAAIQSLGRIKK